MNYLVLAILTCLVQLRVYISVTEISWDFDSKDVNGWGQEATKVINVEVTMTNNELRGNINGLNPIIDSPSLFMIVGRRNYCVIRMAYSGSAVLGRLLLLSSPTTTALSLSKLNKNSNNSSESSSNVSYSTNQNLDFKLQKSWEDTVIVVPSSNIPATSDAHSIDKIADASYKTSYIANISNQHIVINFDLQVSRWISSVALFPLEGMEPRKCLLLRSLSNDDSHSQFMTVKSFVVHRVLNSTNATQSSTTVTGFNEYARYWQLIILDTYQSLNVSVSNISKANKMQVGISEIEFQGMTNDASVVPFAVNNTNAYTSYYIPMYTSNLMQHPLIGIRLEILHRDATLPITPSTAASSHTQQQAFKREGIAIDYIRITRAPLIWRVRGQGCVNVYYDVDVSLLDAFDHSIFSSPDTSSASSFSTADLVLKPLYKNDFYNVTSQTEYINNERPMYYYYQHSFPTFEITKVPFKYAATFDCPLVSDGAGTDIYVDGIDFGRDPTVHIDGKLCPMKSQIFSEPGSRVSTVICTLPSFSGYDLMAAGDSLLTRGGLVTVRIQDAVHPGLMYESKLLSYRMAPPKTRPLVVRHVRSHAVDVSWVPPGEGGRLLDSLVTTGYTLIWRPLKLANITAMSSEDLVSMVQNGELVSTIINNMTEYYQPISRRQTSNMTVGNITFTSIKGLNSNAPYQFAIAAQAEGGGQLNSFQESGDISSPDNVAGIQYPSPTDSYGRRERAKTALVGEYSDWSHVVLTPSFDITMSFPHSTNCATELFLTPLTIDGNSTNGTSVSKEVTNIADPFQYSAPQPAYILLDGNSHNPGIMFKMMGSASLQSVASTVAADEAIARFLESNDHVTRKFAGYPDSGLCRSPSSSNHSSRSGNISSTNSSSSMNGSSVDAYNIIRLTNSAARQSGAAWYPHKVNVREGFDTTFSFYLSSPSVLCDIMGDVNSLCRSRGADGLAFVIHNPDYAVDSTAYDTTSPDYNMDSTIIEVDSLSAPPSAGVTRPPTAGTQVLGAMGSGLGYDGIANGLSVEIDTFSNSDKFDPYENHVAVMTAVTCSLLDLLLCHIRH